jgi:hypothetical protein
LDLKTHYFFVLVFECAAKVFRGAEIRQRAAEIQVGFFLQIHKINLSETWPLT